jgi:hypothetical protein
MNTRSNHNLVILMVFTILLAMACNTVTLFPKSTSLPLTTATLEPKLIHFENDIVAFDYPAGMMVFNATDPAFIPYPFNVTLGGQMVAGLADPTEIGTNGYMYRTLGIFRQTMLPGSNLEQVMEEAYKPMNRTIGYVDATGPVKLAGLPAYQQTYSFFDSRSQTPYEMRDIWVEKDNVIFRASVWTPPHNPENFAAFQSVTDKIIKSLIIKDNLPPIFETPTSEPTASPTPFPASMLVHFENDVVAFDYLKGMKVYSASDSSFQCYPDFQLGGEMVAGLGDPKLTGFGNYYRSIRIFRQQIPAGSNLEAIMLEAYRVAEEHFQQENGILNSSSPFTVSGLSAVQRTYRVYSGEPVYEMRDIWIQRDNELYIIAIWTDYTNPDDFAAFQAGADVLLESLYIK